METNLVKKENKIEIGKTPVPLKRIISLKNILKDTNISDKEIDEAKKSLYL